MVEGIYLLDALIDSARDKAEVASLKEQRSRIIRSQVGREALALKVVGEVVRLAERARSAVSAHRIMRGGLPSSLRETDFFREDKLDYVEYIAVNSRQLSVKLAGSGDLPPTMRGQEIFWSLEKAGVRIEASCSHHTTIEEPSLRDALGCSS